MLVDLNRPDEALACADQAIAINPSLPKPSISARTSFWISNASTRLLRAKTRHRNQARPCRGNVEPRTVQTSGRTLQRRPDGVRVALGNRSDGAGAPTHQTGRVVWAHTDIAGKTILLHAEQGFGDALMAVRYAPRFIERGARVILEVPAPLRPLLAEIAGVAQTVIKGRCLSSSYLLSIPTIRICPYVFTHTYSPHFRSSMVIDCPIIASMEHVLTPRIHLIWPKSEQ